MYSVSYDRFADRLSCRLRRRRLPTGLADGLCGGLAPRLAAGLARARAGPSPATQAIWTFRASQALPWSGAVSWRAFSLLAVAGFSLVMPWAYRLGLIDLEGGSELEGGRVYRCSIATYSGTILVSDVVWRPDTVFDHFPACDKREMGCGTR